MSRRRPLQYLAERSLQTSVIQGYLERFGNPRKFPVAAGRADQTDRRGESGPILGRVPRRGLAYGALAANDAVVGALFRQAGVIRTDASKRCSTSRPCWRTPRPPGPARGDSDQCGRPGILAADACEAHGLELPLLSEATRSELRSFLPVAASVSNPVDMLASAPVPNIFAAPLPAILRTNSIDSVITIFIPPLVTEPHAVAAAIARCGRWPHPPTSPSSASS